MDFELLKLIIEKNYYGKKALLLQLFLVTELKPEGPSGTLISNDDGVFLNDDGELVPVTYPINPPMLNINDKVELPANTLPNQPKAVTTTWGVIFSNLIMLVYPVGDKIEFINGLVTYKEAESDIVRLLKSGEITVDEVSRFLKSTGFLTGLVPYITPTATEKAMGGNPAIKKRVKELVKENKDSMGDPLTMARIEGEISKLDREYLEDDPSAIFYAKGKYYNITRKRMHYMYGGEKSIDDPNKLSAIESSLEDGWDMDKMPEMVNALRVGSRARGSETALGGTVFKILVRIFQNYSIKGDDCGVKYGRKVLITKDNTELYTGRHLIGGGTLTAETIPKHIGKVVHIRSPAYCKTSPTSFCKKCVGDRLSATPEAIGMLASNVGSAMLDAFMAAMHGKTLKVQRISLDDIIS